MRNSAARLLDSLVAALELAPAAARPILYRQWLPGRLRALVDGSNEIEVWRAWTNGDEALLVVGSESSALTERFGGEALHAFFYDSLGRLVRSGAYARSRGGTWRRVEEMRSKLEAEIARIVRVMR